MEENLINFYKKFHIDYHILTSNERFMVKKYIEDTYVNKDVRHGVSLFDFLKVDESVGVSDFDSWKWVYPFIKGKKVVMFFHFEQVDFIELSDGGPFFEFFEDCPKVEFYMIDLFGTFFLGYNHSHCLFTMGTAADWLEQNENYLKFYGYGAL